ncbi:MAG: hypothetical protein R2848_01350 [Thermomicrobiales bacterium]
MDASSPSGDDAHFRHVMTVKDAEPADVVASGVGEDAPAGFGCWVWVRSAQPILMRW